jgi:Xaa-Pro aminopeptidase
VNNLLPDINKFALLITRLDDVVWLTNFRGSVIAYYPVFFAFALLFVDSKEKLRECKLFAEE